MMGQVYGIVWDYAGGELTRQTPGNDPLRQVTTQIDGQPYGAVGSQGGESPFDQLAPWKNMVRYNISQDGQPVEWVSYEQDTVVWIPQFWASIRLDDVEQKLYIYLADEPLEGLSLHPGSGRYVARYATGPNFVSRTGQDPVWGESRDYFRQGATAKGAGWAQYDIAAYSAVSLLYLVEWCDWDSQGAIGKGVVQEVDMPAATGGTDGMTYHTGRAAGTDGQTTVQYRWLENLWGNVAQWVDGFNTQDGQVYVCLDPQQWQDAVAQGYQQAGVVMPGAGWITRFSPGQLGWALLPDQVAAQSDGHVPDYTGRGLGQDGWRGLVVGGMCGDGDKAGLFHFLPDIYPEYGDIFVGGRMQFIPPVVKEVRRVNARIQLKRDTEAAWTEKDPVIQSGEWIIVETSSGIRCKVGDGQKTYSQLGFVDDAIYVALNEKMPSTGGTVSGPVKITDTTQSTGETTGALVVSGGVGIDGDVYANRVFGAAWNDYAERRIVEEETVLPGQVACETGNDTLALSTQRMQPMAYVITDTYGMEIGRREYKAQPVGVSGRVLVRVEGDRTGYQVGDALCAAPGGVACKMTPQEAAANPQALLGYVCSVPDYESWGNDEYAVQVDGRIWMRIR